MALVIEIWKSVSGSTSDDAFSLLTSLPDTGAPITFDNVPVTPPERLYAYRARRRDTDYAGTPCEYSDWSKPVFLRAPYPERTSTVDADDIVTGVETSIYLGIEAVKGIPVKVTDIGPYLSGGVGHDVGRRYSRQLRNAPTMRRKVTRGLVTFEGSIELEITPEGFVPKLLCALFPVAVTPLINPPRYRARWNNAFGSKTVTVVQRKGQNIEVYPGTRVRRMEAVINKEDDNPMSATFELVALDKLVFPLKNNPTILADLGISGATEDASEIYTSVDAECLIANIASGVRSVTYTVARDLGRRQELDRRRGASGTREGMAETSGSANLYYENNVSLERDFGVIAPAAGFAVGDHLITAPVITSFLPPDNAAGFANELVFAFPQADVKTTQTVSGPDEVPEDVTFSPIDAIGETANTDFYIEIENQMSLAALTTPSDPFVGTTSWNAMTQSKSKRYEWGAVLANPAPSTTVFALSDTPDLRDVNDFYNGREIRFLSGALKGVTRTVQDYDGATHLVTLTTALPSVPATGDKAAFI